MTSIAQTGPSARHGWPVVVLALTAIAAALYVTEPISAPLALAAVTGMVMGPVHARICRLGVPAAVSAGLTMLGMFVLAAGLALLFRPWVTEVVERAPQIGHEIRRVLIDMRLALVGLFNLQDEVMEAISTGSGAGAATPADSGTELPSLADAAWLAPAVLARALVFVAGLFFFLYGRQDLYASIAQVSGPTGPRVRDFRTAERRVSRYFGAITLINFGFGAAVAIALTLLGVPGAPVWGMIAALANFVLYIGPAMVALALLIAGILTSPSLSAFLPATVFVGLNFIEGQFVTPMIVGRSLRQNPLVVFASLAFWLWMWGPLGGIVAIPILLWGHAMWARLRTRATTIAGQAPDGPSSSLSSTASPPSAMSSASGSNSAGSKQTRKT